MTLTSSIVVRRPLDDVWTFLTNLQNVPTWDRSIARAVLRTPGPLFRSAELIFTLENVDGGTRITHEIDVRMRVWFAWLSAVPVRGIGGQGRN